MARSIKQIYGKKLKAADGEIGQVKSFYFDVRNWAVRYVIAETGNWLMSRQVLLAPHALGDTRLATQVLTVNLTRKQIEDGPALEWHKPVSRQYEAEYFHFYGWPCYWHGEGLWGQNDFPILKRPARRSRSKPATTMDPHYEYVDAHLRSTQAVRGYRLQANDKITGRVCDFIMDDQQWAIGHLVVETGRQLGGKKMHIPVSSVDRISYEEATVFVNLKKEGKSRSSPVRQERAFTSTSRSFLKSSGHFP